MRPYNRYSLVVIILLFATGILPAQFTANYWPLDGVSVDFSLNPPGVQGDVPYGEAYATTSIGDAAGNLLFFATQDQVYNASGEPLAGGDFTEISEDDYPEQPLLVPIPGRIGRFLLLIKMDSDITTLEDGSIVNGGGFYLVELDIALNGGTGGVVPGSRRYVGAGYIFQKLTAVQDPQSGDYWVLGRNYTGVQFVAYRITNSGLVDVPVVTDVDLPPVDGSFFTTQLKFSPDAKYVASAYSTSVFDANEVSGFILLAFNSVTGVLDLRETIDLPTNGRNASGLEFSADATKLYAYQEGSSGEEGLYQYNLSRLPGLIAPTQVDLGELELTGGMSLQLAANGKIYITKGGGSITGANYLGVINQPNEVGEAADFVELGLFIAEGDEFFGSVFELPTIVQSFYYRNSIHLGLACTNRATSFSPANDHLVTVTEWDFGDGSPVSNERNPEHIYTESGDYTVQLIVGGTSGRDTLTREITVHPTTPLDLGEDRAVCVGSSIGLNERPNAFAIYIWSTGDTTPTLRIDTAGAYVLTAANTQGCPSADTVELSVNALPVITLADTIEITGDSLTVTPGDFTSYAWSTGDTTATLAITAPQFYSVVVADTFGCRADKTFLTYRGALPPTVSDDGVWRLINPRPSTEYGRRIQYLDAENGFILTDTELLVTRDGGRRWGKTLDLNQAIDLQFAGRTGYLLSRNSLYQSTYNGRGWNRLPISGSAFVGLSVISNDTIVLASNDAQHLSTDGGRSWTRRGMNLTGFVGATIHFTSPDTGFCISTAGHLFATDDGGNTWSQRGEAPIGGQSTDHQIVFFNDQLGFATRGRWSIYRTTDGGQTWTVPNLGVNRYFGIHFVDQRHAYLLGELGSVAFTDNGGITWENRNDGRNGYDGWGGAFFFDQNHGTAVGRLGRIATTRDGGRSWMNYAPSYRRIDNARLDADGNGYLVSQGEYSTTSDAGENWQRQPAITEGEKTLNVAPFNDSVQLAVVESSRFGVSTGNTLHHTQDGGETWRVIDLELARFEEIEDLQLLNDSVAHVTIKDIGSASRTFRTDDSGLTWGELDIPLFKKIALVDDTLAYGISGRQSLYQSKDAGLTWTLNYSLDFGQLNDFAFLSPTYGYLVGDSGVRLRTTDGGREWTTFEGLPYDDYVAMVFSTPLRGYAITDNGAIYRTDDAGARWEFECRKFGLENLQLTEGLIIGWGDFGRFYARSAASEPAAAIASIDLTTVIDTAADIQLGLLSTIDSLRIEVVVKQNNNFETVYTYDDLVATSGEMRLNLLVDGLRPSTRYKLEARLLTLTDNVVATSNLEFTTTALVSIGNSTVLPELKLHPSPTTGPLYIELPAEADEQPYRLLGPDGRLLASGILRQGSGLLDLTPYPSGLYFIQIGSVSRGLMTYRVIRR